jgi:hypothetical protein
MVSQVRFWFYIIYILIYVLIYLNLNLFLSYVTRSPETAVCYFENIFLR